ncbi:heme biosynthesis HemY N-terminal domain-containing protein [Pseudoalteromonas sp. S16_S37]|uniref:heme biosynthesis HemY N-terminal domain-containing protein n=1 Tax=Pseudoalteromonas sp. S16_S37 TaxID=2720228 RepID=UPI001680467B|nr:heme biosynthesis HemY N-terminal domain-containing protein [Pseudoalteromonas sp. S16_S37]MBD1582686.1 heme biosynthesis protein [Pseudoalteromonas sp. S16_S37]
MKSLLLIFVFAAVLASGHLLVGDAGYVLIAFGKTTLEGTVYSFGALLLMVLILLLILKAVVGWLWKGYRSTTGHFSNKKRIKSEQALTDAIWGVLNDDVQMIKSAFTKNDAPMQWQDQQHAMLAKAALQSGEQAEALQHLQAMSDESQAQVPKLWLNANQSEQALALLSQPMQQKKPNAAAVSSYLDGLLHEQQLADVVTTLSSKYKQLDLATMQWHSFFKRFFDSAKQQASDYFSQLPKAVQAHAQLAYLQSMAGQSCLENVHDVLIKLLKKGQFSQLAQVLAYAKGADIKLTQAIQTQLKKKPEHSELLFCLACMANAEGDFELATKIFASLPEQDWQRYWIEPALYSFEQTGQFQRAYQLARHQW